MSEVLEADAERAASAVPAATLSCGELLKAAREARGMSYSDVAQRLKYAPRQVQALEEGRFDALPGLTFQRGFIRGYAKLVGLDANELVSLLEVGAVRDGGPTTMQLQQIASLPATMPARTEGRSAWPWILGMILAVVGIGGYTLYEWEAPARLVKSTATVPAPPVAGTPNPPVASADTADRSVPMPQPSADTGIPGGGGLRSASPPVDGTARGSGKIHLAFTGASWVEVRQADGAVVFSGLNNAGMEQWIDGEAPFDLVIGDARSVKLVYRGNEINLEPYTKATVAKLQLK